MPPHIGALLNHEKGLREELGITFLEFKALVHLKGTRCSRPLMLKSIKRIGKELGGGDAL